MYLYRGPKKGPKGDPFFWDSGQDSEGGPKKGTQI